MRPCLSAETRVHHIRDDTEHNGMDPRIACKIRYNQTAGPKRAVIRTVSWMGLQGFSPGCRR